MLTITLLIVNPFQTVVPFIRKSSEISKHIRNRLSFLRFQGVWKVVNNLWQHSLQEHLHVESGKILKNMCFLSYN